MRSQVLLLSSAMSQHKQNKNWIHKVSSILRVTPDYNRYYNRNSSTKDDIPLTPQVLHKQLRAKSRPCRHCLKTDNVSCSA